MFYSHSVSIFRPATFQVHNGTCIKRLPYHIRWCNSGSLVLSPGLTGELSLKFAKTQLPRPSLGWLHQNLWEWGLGIRILLKFSEWFQCAAKYEEQCVDWGPCWGVRAMKNLKKSFKQEYGMIVFTFLFNFFFFFALEYSQSTMLW